MKKKLNFARMLAVMIIFQCVLLQNGVYAQHIQSDGVYTDSIIGNLSAGKASPVVALVGLKIVKESDSSLKLTWGKAAGVSGYSVYKWDAKAQKYRITKTLPGGKSVAWTDKKLKSNVTYKYKVRAFKNVSGKKQYGAYSNAVSASAYTTKAKTVNASSIQVDYSARYLGLNGVKKVFASVIVSKGKNALSKTLTWKSTNRSIVKVNQYGWIEAQGKPGKAKVIIRAHNGVTRTLVITVADYARPAKFTNLDKVKKWNKTASSVLSKYRIEITSIAAWLERIKKEVRFLYEDNNLQYDYNVINFEVYA